MRSLRVVENTNVVLDVPVLSSQRTGCVCGGSLLRCIVGFGSFAKQPTVYLFESADFLVEACSGDREAREVLAQTVVEP